jgi:hypothetical protein
MGFIHALHLLFVAKWNDCTHIQNDIQDVYVFKTSLRVSNCCAAAQGSGYPRSNAVRSFLQWE